MGYRWRTDRRVGKKKTRERLLMPALMWRFTPTLTMAVCAGRDPGTTGCGGCSRSDRGDDMQKQGTEIPPLHSV
jgi:hypothetical protein